MNFELTPEQTMLRDGSRRFVTEYLAFGVQAGREDGNADHWARLAELGWFMLPVPENYGGLGGSTDDIAIIAEELGRGLALEPFVEAAILPAQLLNIAGSGDQRAELLPALATGEMRFAVALLEPRRGFDLVPDHTRAFTQADGFRLSGGKLGVEAAQHANRLIVSAQLDGVSALFMIDADAAGVKRCEYETIDSRWLSDFTFDDVFIPDKYRLAADIDIDAAIAQAIDGTIVAECAEALGCMDKAIELTADYFKARQQFGQPLANFQALQHGVANLFIDSNDARSITYRAMSMMNAPADVRMRAVSAAKIKVMEAARTVIGTAVHYHGAIGVTTEYSIGHYLRRVLVLEQRYGNAAYHFERLVG